MVEALLDVQEDVEEDVEEGMDLLLAENEDTDSEQLVPVDYVKKRELLSKTKIAKQTWSIVEIYQKISGKSLILDPSYQRNKVWSDSKQIPFIESLFMGIIIPPIYVVEIPTGNVLEGSKYEVVDGKQRLTTIEQFISNELVLKAKHLEYYGDIFDKLKFNDIQKIAETEVNELLSSVLDVYVITANSPEFTKYDIFARLNKGSEKLKVNEIRKAIYRSDVLVQIETFIDLKLETKDSKYHSIFTKNDIKRYDDYGRFFSSIAYYLKMNSSEESFDDYNSRPRDMINDVLYSLQSKTLELSKDELDKIIDTTIHLKDVIKNDHANYFIDACIYFAIKYDKKFSEVLQNILTDSVILESFVKSPSTTSNVNARVKRIKEIING